MEHQCLQVTGIVRRTVVFVVMLTCAVNGKPWTMYEKVNAVEGKNVSLKCKLNVIYPLWQGPPSLSIYNSHSIFSQDVPCVKAGQCLWHSNKKNLIIISVNKSNGGIYKCTSGNQVEFSMELVVEVALKTSRAQGSIKHNKCELSSKQKVKVSTQAGYVAFGLSVSPLVIIWLAITVHYIYTACHKADATSEQGKQGPSETNQADEHNNNDSEFSQCQKANTPLVQKSNSAQL